VRFHGVATAYLPNYLAWMRLFETEELSEKVWLSIAINANQQRMPT
ncbi:MAG TPA: IS1595 family transposase, partial [Thiopseudomonas sp.]|nr:IS1595 family transposase [Thiopseudomonas sp.]